MDNKIDSSAPLKDYEIEVDAPKTSFFSRIMDRLSGKEEKKAIGDGKKETFQRTNRSISSMWTVASLRRTLMEKLENLNESLFRKPERVDQSNITTHVIGRDDVKKDELSQETEKTTVDRIIPVAKSAAAKANRIIPQPVKTGLINNAKSAKDVKEEVAQTQGMRAEEVEISDDFIDEYENNIKGIDDLTAGDIINNASKNTIEAAEINVGEKQSKQQERNDDDDRDL